MAQKVIRNDFVAGEISPELWGRHDLEMYHHGAAKIENFIPRRTGGLRKRAGTELVWHISGNTARDYLIVPYRYNKDEFGLLAIIYRPDVSQAYWRFWSSRTGSQVKDGLISFLTISSSTPLSALRHEQIGDTIFFTLHGLRAFKAVVTFATGAVTWSQLKTSIAVASPPTLDTSASGFGTAGESNYVSASRKYCIWGVKDGIRSAKRTKQQNMTLAWKAGAYIDVTFTPNWAKHDYYILGKLQGGQYGEVARFYRDSDNGSRNYTDSFTYGAQTDTGTIDGVSYTAGTGNPKTLWKTTDPDTTENGIHTCGSWVKNIRMTHTDPTAPLLALKLWFGAIMTKTGTSTTANVGYSSPVHVVLKKIVDENTQKTVAEWDLIPGYQTEAAKLSIDTPVAGPTFGLYFYTEKDGGDTVWVPMRGLIMCTDSGQKTFHDDNIAPGTLVGEQDLLPVGSTGMDVDLITTWQQRLIAASSSTLPFTMWFSTVGDLTNFYVDRPQTSDNAFEATIASIEGNKIIHIISQKWLLVFTESGEYIVDSTGGVLAYNTIDIKKLSSIGAHDGIPPLTTESEVLFVAHDSRSVYKMDYTLERDAVVPTNLSVRAEHIASAHRIVATAYQRYPDSVLWCLLDDGSLASLTFFPDEQVCAWARHTLAGGDGLKAVNIFGTGSVRSATDTATTSDTFLVLTHENMPGDIWVERLRPCVDVDSPSTSAATCADHMSYAAADYPGGINPQGHIQASVETIRLEPQQADTIGMMTSQFFATLRILRSGAVAVRPVSGSDQPWRKATLSPTLSGSNVKLARGDARVSPTVVYNRDGRIEIKSDDQWPCDILALCVCGNFGTMRDGG